MWFLALMLLLFGGGFGGGFGAGRPMNYATQEQVQEGFNNQSVQNQLQ